MRKTEEERRFTIFVNGLRDHIKESHTGNFQGKPLAPNWSELDDATKDQYIDRCFVENVLLIGYMARQAIHGQ